MRMTDIISEAKWAELEQEIFERFGVNACVYDDQGFTFTGQKLFANAICPAIKARPEGLQAICSVAHQNMAAIAKNTGRPVIEECDAGLLKICIPVSVNGEFIGVVGGCGRLPEGGEVDTFAVHMAAGIPEDELEKLAADCEIMETHKAEEMAEFLEGFIAGILASRTEA